MLPRRHPAQPGYSPTSPGKGFREVIFPPSGHSDYDNGAVCVCVCMCVCVSMKKVLSFLSFPLPEYSELSERSEKHEFNADRVFTKALFPEPLTLSDDGG